MADSKRDAYFDNAKFILIYLVIFGHVISPIKGDDHGLFTLYTTIFLFHMPGFILISGYFAKGFRRKGYLLKLVKKLLVPYLIFQAIFSAFYFWNGDEASFNFSAFTPHWTLWFLLSLFFWHVLLFAFARFRWAGLAVAFAIGVGIGYIDWAGEPLSLSRTFFFFPFFFLGYLLEGKHFEQLRTIRFAKPIGLVILVAIGALFWSAFPKDATDWLLASHSYADMGTRELTDGLIRIGQYGLALIALIGLMLLVPKKSYSLTIIGQRTLTIYLLHGFIIKTIETFVSHDTLKQFADQYGFLLIFSWILCLILGSYPVKKWASPLTECRIE